MSINTDDVVIEIFKKEDETGVVELIRRTLQRYEEAGNVLAATFRRIDNMFYVYSQDATRYFIAKETGGNPCLGGAGIGPFHGLPASEGIGEVRDMVLEKQYRGLGIGARLLKRCVDEAKAMGYKRLYLETTPKMAKAQKLFVRFGFRAVTQAQQELTKVKTETAIPCYYVLDNLDSYSS